MNHRNHWVLGTALSVLTFGFSFQDVAAQESSADLIDEILVTANRRSATSIQNMAGSIQAIGSQELVDLNAEGFEDYIKLVPGLTSISSGTGQTQLVIRGVNSGLVNHQAVQARSLAGIYLDDMPIALDGFNPDLGLLDIERIEVLRGPQGTLYGASSMSGTVRLISKDPDPGATFGKLDGSVSNTFDGGINYTVKGSANVPVSDNSAFKIGAYYIDRDGFIDNAAPGGQSEYNSEDVVGLRAVYSYFGDSFTASVSGIYNEINADGRPDEMRAAETFQAVEDTNQRNFDLFGTTIIENTPITGRLQSWKPFRDTFSSEFLAANVALEWELENYDIVASLSYLETEVVNPLDEFFRFNLILNLQAAGLDCCGGGPVAGIPETSLLNNTLNESLVGEFRVSSKNDGPTQWVLGMYYEDADRTLGPRTFGGPGLEEVLIAANQPVETSNPDTILDATEVSSTTQTAFFGEMAFAITDAVELTVGARVFDYDADFVARSNGLIFGRPNESDITDVGTNDESDWLGKAQVQWQASDDLMFYALYSEGFRLGGIADALPDSCNPELEAIGAQGGGGAYDSDQLDNSEVGVKSTWMEGRLVANLSLYRIDWRNIQQVVDLNCGFSTTLNVGAIENNGVEGEFRLQATENFGMRLGFASVDAEVTEAPDVDSPINRVGDKPPYVPELTWSASVDYSGVQIGRGEAFFRADARYVDDSLNEFSSSASAEVLPSYTILDLTVGYAVGPWSFLLFGRNVTDEEVISNIDPERASPLQFTRGVPATVGVSVTRNFE